MDITLLVVQLEGPITITFQSVALNSTNLMTSLLFPFKPNLSL